MDEYDSLEGFMGGLTVYNIFMGGYDCLEHFYGSVWVDVTG